MFRWWTYRLRLNLSERLYPRGKYPATVGQFFMCYPKSEKIVRRIETLIWQRFANATFRLNIHKPYSAFERSGLIIEVCGIDSDTLEAWRDVVWYDDPLYYEALRCNIIVREDLGLYDES